MTDHDPNAAQYRELVRIQKPRLTHCKSEKCGAAIYWIRTATGSALCVDADGEFAYSSHWRTCKDRERFKRDR